MNETNFSKTVIIQEIKQPTQTIVVNGVEKHIEETVPVTCCPKCGRVLNQFNPNTSMTSVIKFLSDNHDSLIKNTTYCPSCGQKLDYPVIIDIGE